MENINELVMQYNNIKEQEKLISAKKKEIGNALKEYAHKFGTLDAKGSSYYTADENWVVGNVKYTSIAFDTEKAKAYLEENHPELLEQVTETVQYISEDKVSKLVTDKVLTLEELEAMCNIKVSYRIDVRQHKDEEEEREAPKVTCKPRVKKVLKRK